MNRNKLEGPLYIWFGIFASLAGASSYYYLRSRGLLDTWMTRNLKDPWAMLVEILLMGIVYGVSSGLVLLLCSRLSKFGGVKVLNDSQLFNKISKSIWFLLLALLAVEIFRKEPTWVLSAAVLLSVWGVAALLGVVMYKRKI
jgi:hypothetical protein